MDSPTPVIGYQPEKVYGIFYSRKPPGLIELAEGDSVVGIAIQNADMPMVRMPCGHTASMADIDMKQDVPCPCGNPKHWLFKRV